MDETPYFLSHLRAHCTGTWQILARRSHTFWFCPAYRAMYRDTVIARDAATREIKSGERVRQLAREGRRLLDQRGPQ